MFLRVGNAWTEVSDASPKEEAFVRDFLSVRTKGRHGKLTFTSLLRSGKFPAGLSRRIVARAREHGFEVHVVKRTSEVEMLGGHSHESWSAFPHQIQAVEEIREHRRGIIQHSTGSGKGDLIAFLCTRFPKARVLVVVTSKELLRDMYRRLREKMKLRSVGRYGDGHREEGRVIVAIDDSLRRMPAELLRRFEVILGDEVHGAAAASYLEPLLQCVNAPYRVGFSGTPLDRADKRTVYILGAFGEVIHRYMPREAAEDGVISKARIVMVPFQHAVHSTRGGYSEWELRAYARNRARNLLALRLLSLDSQRSMGFLRTIKHQEELAKLVGASALTVNHEDSAEDMDRALQLFRGGGKILLSTPILRQGTDIAEVERVVNLAGGKAIVDVIQKVGRGSRIRQPDGTLKESFEVYDIDDRGCGCGVRGEPTSYLHKSCEWLERHSDERRAAYWKYGYTVHDS